jgi:hypothetical protein
MSEDCGDGGDDDSGVVVMMVVMVMKMMTTMILTDGDETDVGYNSESIIMVLL